MFPFKTGNVLLLLFPALILSWSTSLKNGNQNINITEVLVYAAAFLH